MEVEISKFDNPVAGELTADTKYEIFLTKLVIEPYASRIPSFLNELFLELNFS